MATPFLGFGHLSARFAGLPCDAPSLPALQHPGDCGGSGPPRDHGRAMSTRYLIILTLITGLVILVAFAVQVLTAR